MPKTASAWQEALPLEERAVYEAAGFGRPGGLSREAALLIVDVTYGFTGHRGESIEVSQQRYPNSCGPHAWAAVAAINRVAQAMRDAGLPVLYSRDVSADVQQDSVWERKHGRLTGRPDDDSTIVDELAPVARDHVIEKTTPSAFFSGELADRLEQLKVRNLIIAGTSTSGCVRATVVDAFSHGLAVTVLEDGVFDRAKTSHDVSLFEMNQKYGDVVNSSTVIDFLRA